jgi:hypothetical protein
MLIIHLVELECHDVLVQNLHLFGTMGDFFLLSSTIVTCKITLIAPNVIFDQRLGNDTY